MATREEVEGLLADLAARLEKLDPAYRSMLPSRRTVEAECPDLGVAYHAFWRHGQLGRVNDGHAERPDIRIRCDSDDLLALASGQLDLREAYTLGRLTIEASMTDLLRLRTVL